MRSGYSNTQIRHDLICRGHAHRSRYKRLPSRFIQILKDAGQEPTMTASASGDRLFPVVYLYPNIVVGSYYCSYWCMIAIQNIVLIGLNARATEHSSPYLPKSGNLSDVDTSAPGVLPLLWLLSERRQRNPPPVASTGSTCDFSVTSEDDATHRRQIHMAEKIMSAEKISDSVESILLSVLWGRCSS